MAEATTIRCELHSTHSVELYCHEHDAVFCRYCKAIKHSECDVKELRELCENTVLEGKLKTTVDQLTALQETTNNALVEKRREQESIKSETKEKRDLSTRLQTELAALIANYEINLQQHEETSSKTIEAEIEACECIAKQVQDQLKLLGEKGDRSGERLFLSLLKARKIGDDYVSVVEKIRNRQTNRLPAVQDEQASKFIQNISSLFGSAESSSEEGDDKIHMKTPSVSFWDIESLAYVKQASVTNGKDGSAPEITGCCFASNSQFCICDYNRSNFSILNEDMNITYSLPMDGNPYDVAAFDEKTVIVSVPERRNLQLIIIPGVKIRCRLDVNSMCYGLKVEKDIYVCVSDHGHVVKGKGYVIEKFYGIRIYSKAGGLRSSIPLAQTENPRSLYLNTDGSKIFYSGGSYLYAHVTCATKDGHGIYRYTDVKFPNTVIVDDHDNVMVCDRDAKMVQVIYSSGIRSKILLTEKDKLDTPLSMCYNKASKVLVVMCADSKGKMCELRVFQLKFS